MDYDALIVGGGIAGMQSALTLGRHGLSRAAGGKGAEHRRQNDSAEQGLPDAGLLELHFHAQDGHHGPSSQHHGDDVRRDRRDRTRCRRRLRGAACAGRRLSSIPTACIGCGECELECARWLSPTATISTWSRAAPSTSLFPQAVPKKAVIATEGISPCTYTCPGGVQAHGYVSLVRAGQYEEAFPPAHAGRAAAGVAEPPLLCTVREDSARVNLAEGKIEIRGAKRFMSDYYYERHPGAGIRRAGRTQRQTGRCRRFGAGRG